MPDLILVADGAFPHPPYDFLPHGVKVWAGYLGGHTPHSWTDSEIAGVRQAGLVFWPIWTAPVGARIGTATGTADGAGMVAALIARKIGKGVPVLYDIEYSTWTASPTGARAAIEAFKRAVASAGYHRSYAYVPLAAGFDWVAHWTGTRPTSLPDGVIGLQYDHALHNDAYDISVFDATLLTAPGGADMPLDPNNQTDKALLDQVADIHSWTRILDFGVNSGAATPFSERGELTHRLRAIDGRLLTVAARLSALGDGGTIDPVALARALADDLGDDLAKRLLDALRDRLQA